MPSHAPLHTVKQLVTAFHDAVKGRNQTEDDRDGSSYDLIAGPSALFWRRLEQRDRDMFRAKYNDTATGQDLSTRLSQLFGISRILDSYGTGAVILTRPTSAGGQGAFWPGTRILVQGGASGSGFYAVDENQPTVTAGAAALQVTVPIRATKFGPGVAIDSSTGATSATIADALWDNTWTVSAFVCADGTLFEKAKDYLARVRSTQLANRVGFVTEITTALTNAGISTVALFGSNYAQNDYGISAVYVGDQSFSGSTSLVRLATSVLEGYRVLGAPLLVAPMARVTLQLDILATLTKDPATLDTLSITLGIQNGIASQFSGATNGYAYSVTGLTGVMQKISSFVHSAVITNVATGLPLVNASIMSGTPPVFPQTLNRYLVPPQNVTVSYTS